MTDHEISKALALAIGYLPEHVRVNESYRCIEAKRPWTLAGHGLWREFDYTDTRVIWPIAQRYDCFPWICGMLSKRYRCEAMKKHTRRTHYQLINPIQHAIAGAAITDTASLDKLRMIELQALEALLTPV